uniref:Xaa-Pro dipeptidase n=1 Tax=Panagrellus redivivus TaxID=6233 RepID=A0A7E4UWM4_PANRE
MTGAGCVSLTSMFASVIDAYLVGPVRVACSLFVGSTSSLTMSFDRGGHTLHISAKLFAENRARLVAALKKQAPPNSVIVLAGGVEHMRYNTDMDDLPFRQESYFFWAFGAHESDSYGAIDVDTGRSILFPPTLAPDFEIWEGKIQPESWFLKKYEVDEVHFRKANTIRDTVTKLGGKNVFLLKAFNEDSKNWLEAPSLPELNHFNIDTKLLYPIFAEARVFKSDAEIEVLRYAAKIATDAHKEVMRRVQPKMYEYQMESLFRHISYFTGGCRHLAYTCIAPTGANAAILHYGGASAPNTKQINDGDICMFDMGPEYNCYASDVSCSFPSNGKFTKKQKTIYNAVLRASQAVFKAAKPGIRWTEMHILAEKVILTDLKAAGIVVGDVDEAVEAGLGGVFMPHGLGHFFGLDVHDVGGYLGDALPRSKRPGLKSLRTTRTLAERMTITIEPGCYFVDTLLDRALIDEKLKKFLNNDILREYRGFGGIRIEDDVVIWAKGNENMSHALPRTVEEIEKFMAKARAQQ